MKKRYDYIVSLKRPDFKKYDLISQLLLIAAIIIFLFFYSTTWKDGFGIAFRLLLLLLKLFTIFLKEVKEK